MRGCRFFIILVPVILLLSTILTAETHEQLIHKLMSEYYEYGQFSGSILVAENGKVVYKNGFGMANREWQIPNTADTKFRLASITKQFTATAILKLVAEGNIKLDGTLSSYLPYYRKDTGDKITIHQLLNHTSGIPSYTSLPGFWQTKMRDPIHVDTLIVKYCSGDLEFEPGTDFRYNNSAYVILGAIIEHVGGESYDAFVKKHIFGPAGMENSGYDHNHVILPNRASGYDKTLFGFKNTNYIHMSVPHAAGALYSTVEDLYLWDRALKNNKLIPAELKQKMFTPELNHYGYGWGIYKVPASSEEDSVKAMGHSGGINGFNTRIYRIPQDDHLVVLLANAPGAQLQSIIDRVVAILYDRDFEAPKKDVAEEIGTLIVEEGLEAATKRYRELKENLPDNYALHENSMNRLGYALLGNQMIDEAITIFTLNTEAFPESANAFDSLAEGYMMAGDKDNAIKYYQKTINMLENDKQLSDQFKERLRKGAKEKLEVLKNENTTG